MSKIRMKFSIFVGATMKYVSSEAERSGVCYLYRDIQNSQQ